MGGTPAVGQVYSVPMNGKVVAAPRWSRTPIPPLSAGCKRRWTASTIPEFKEVLWSVLAAVLNEQASNAGDRFHEHVHGHTRTPETRW